MFMQDKQIISIISVNSVNDTTLFYSFVCDEKNEKNLKYIGQVDDKDFAKLFTNAYRMYDFLKILRDNAEYDKKSSRVFKMACNILDDIEGNQEAK